MRIWPERSNDAPYEIVLVTHQDLRHTARIRVTIDEIVLAFRRVAALRMPGTRRR